MAPSSFRSVRNGECYRFCLRSGLPLKEQLKQAAGKGAGHGLGGEGLTAPHANLDIIDEKRIMQFIACCLFPDGGGCAVQLVFAKSI